MVDILLVSTHPSGNVGIGRSVGRWGRAIVSPSPPWPARQSYARATGESNDPRRFPAGVVKFAQKDAASAADLEHLAAALRTGARQRRLAVLHRDACRVHDLDLHLVLHAIG